jgi:hypothetical protein
MATGSRVENTTNEPASQEVDSRKLHKRTHGHRFESRKRDERTHRHPVESRKHDELTHRLRVKHPKTQRTNPSAIESNVESSQNRTRQVGSDASFAKRSQFRPNRMLSHELSTVFAHRVWSALALVVGSCGTGQPASERMAVCGRPSAGGGRARGPRRMRHAVKRDNRIHRSRGRESGTEHNETNCRPLDYRSNAPRANMITRVGWNFAKRSQLCPNRMLGRELSTVFAHRKWYSLTPKAGMCGTGPQASQQRAPGDRQCVGIERDSNTRRSNPDPERWGG